MNIIEHRQIKSYFLKIVVDTSFAGAEWREFSLKLEGPKNEIGASWWTWYKEKSGERNLPCKLTEGDS